MGVALEEPREDDERFEIGGVPLAIPPDVAGFLEVYDDAILDHDPSSPRTSKFFVRIGRRSWGCS
jgi:hypothetical protein